MVAAPPGNATPCFRTRAATPRAACWRYLSFHSTAGGIAGGRKRRHARAGWGGVLGTGLGPRFVFPGTSAISDE
eukprot:4654837-Lingulodinium_polyedra.AAC.1